MANIAENAPEEAAVPQAANATGKYHPLMELGRGGMAIVQAAVARGLGGFSKVVVLKKPRPEFAEQPEAVSTFLNEARISARMNHPNVVQVNEVYEEDGLPVIVMEYLEGQSFARLLQRYFEGAGGSLELGLSDKEIADRLQLPLATARTYVARTLRRLGVNSRRELMVRGG